MTKLLPPLVAGAALDPNAYFFATFKRSVFGWLETVPGADTMQQVADRVYDALRAGAIEYATPINTSEWTPGDDVVVFAIRTVPGAEQHVVGEFAAALNDLSVFASCYTLREVDFKTAYSAGARAQEQSGQQTQWHIESPLTKLENAGITAVEVVVALVVLVILFFAWKFYQEARS